MYLVLVNFQLYQTTGRELCIVVTNLSQMTSEYFHVKTTPNVPIVTAVKMSTAIPGSTEIIIKLCKLFISQ